MACGEDSWIRALSSCPRYPQVALSSSLLDGKAQRVQEGHVPPREMENKKTLRGTWDIVRRKRWKSNHTEATGFVSRETGAGL